MAALVTFVVPNLDEDLYAQVSAGIQADPPAGLLVHAASVVDGGMRIHDVWESPEAFEKFARSTLGPAMADSPAGQPEGMSVTPLHAHWIPSA